MPSIHAIYGPCLDEPRNDQSWKMWCVLSKRRQRPGADRKDCPWAVLAEKCGQSHVSLP